MRIEDLYDTAQACGLLSAVQAPSGQTVWCGWSMPDDTLLDGLVQSAHYQLRYPASRMALHPGDTVTIDGKRYTVRSVRAVGDGSEMHAEVSRQ